MSIRKLKILKNQISINIPDWILFAFELGSYVNDNAMKFGKPISILLSLPSDQYFPLFITMGIADNKFSVNKQKSSIRKQILALEKGSRIIYHDDNGIAKVMSVISIEQSPVFKNEMILWIQDRDLELGVPENQWIERIKILDKKLDEIKRPRKVSKKKEVGLDGNNFLTELYSYNNLNNASFYPGDYFYIVGNVAMLSAQMNEDIFIYNGIKGKVKDFLYMDNKNSYTNGKLFSSHMKKIEVEINENVPVIYTNISSFIKQSRLFEKNPKIIIFSRMDIEHRLHEVKEELKRELLQGDYILQTNEIIDYMKMNDITIPNGIELFAWR